MRATVSGLPTDPVHRHHVRGEELVGGPLVGVADEPVGVDGDRRGGRIESGGLERAPIQVAENGEPVGVAADDGEGEGEPAFGGPNDGLRRATDGDPDRQRVLHRSRVDRLVLERWAEPAGPGDGLVVADGEEQVELLGEQGVVVGE